jgi:adenine phosphoribosyltransferase
MHAKRRSTRAAATHYGFPAVARRVSDLASRLLDVYRGVDGIYEPSPWWRDPSLLRELVAGLSSLHANARPTVVVGIESRGLLLGPLVAQHLDIGFVEVRKDEHPEDVGEPLLRRTTPPDYRKRGRMLTMRRHLIGPRDDVLVVDDWIETGAQLFAARSLVSDAGAGWIGAAVIVDALSANVRRKLNVLALLRVEQLP